MMGGRGVVGSPLEYTKIDQNSYSSITKQVCIEFVLRGSYNPIHIEVDSWKEVGVRISH